MDDVNNSLIEIKDLAFRFSPDAKVIFDGLSLNIPRESIVAIMGPSGTGKTTLLNLIGGRFKPISGSIKVAGEEVATLSKKALFQLRRKMGMLFQEGGLFTDMNVFDNVAFPLRQHTELSEVMIRDLVLMILQSVGLRGAAELEIEALSGGMMRRVALARSIILGPEIMLYDEPFAGQDPIGRGVLLRLIKELNTFLRLTSVLVSHDVNEAIEIADYVYIISEGKIMGHGKPDTLMDNDVPQVKQFLRGLPDGPVKFQYPARDYGEDLRID